VAALVQQYLDRIRAEHAEVNDGALASYIPELTRVDPNGFGLSLSSGDGYVYESGDAAIEFTIQSISKPFTYASNPPVRRSTRSASTRRPRRRRTR
jgi:glutaminase